MFWQIDIADEQAEPLETRYRQGSRSKKKASGQVRGGIGGDKFHQGVFAKPVDDLAACGGEKPGRDGTALSLCCRIQSLRNYNHSVILCLIIVVTNLQFCL